MASTSNIIDLRRYWRAIKQGKWVTIPVSALLLIFGIILSVKTLPQYTVLGSMLIEDIGGSDNAAGGMAQMMKTFSVGGFGGSSVDNEILVLDSYDVMQRTVRHLGLTREYVAKDADGHKTMLYNETPIRVEAPVAYFDTLSTAYRLRITMLADGKVDIKVQTGLLQRTICHEENVTLPKMIHTGAVNVNVLAVDSLFATTPYREITVNIESTNAVASRLLKEVYVGVQSKLADVIDVSYKCANLELGKAIVNAIMAEYNAKRRERLHEAAREEIDFYDSRIAEVFPLLEDREKQLAEYIRDNSLTGGESQAEFLMMTANETRLKAQEMSHDIMYYEMVLRTLRDRLNDDVVIPQIESIPDQSIVEYNTAVLKRRDLRRSATDDNVALQLADERVETLRGIIIENAENTISKYRNKLSFEQSSLGSLQNRLNKYPGFQLEYYTMMRDKEFASSLYMYLLQQRENSVMQFYTNTDTGFIYQPAFMEKKPSVLPYLLWPLVTIVLSIIGTLCFGLILMWWSRKVKEPMDLAFIRCDSNAVGPDGDTADRMRTMLLLRSALKVLYSLDLTGEQRAAVATEAALVQAGKRVDVIEGLADNAALLTPAVQQQIASLLEGGADYVIVKVPQPEAVYQLESLIDSPEAAVILGITCNKEKRSYLKKLLRGQTAEKIYTIISH